ncbi:MAG: hypothetical protein JW807_13660 [Spirochaetes bacterium]|nr:hypothetical protein [Spirochaetota bacterium]
MSLRRKIILAITFSLMSCLGCYLILSKIFTNLENQLYEKSRIEALTGARAMSEIMYFMIKNNMIGKEAIFDTNYIEIPGTNPKKYHTRYDLIFDRWIQDVEDQFLLDEDVEFAVLMDKNGYVPTHNKKYSLPQTNNYARDVIYSRSKRNFYAYEGIKKILSYNGDSAVRELYNRDTGETLWNIAAPVRLYGQQWGSFIIGINLNRTETIKNQMLVLIIITMSVILVLTNLVILALIPRRFIPKILTGDGRKE